MPSSKDDRLTIQLDCGQDVSDTRTRKIITKHLRSGATAALEATFTTDGRDGMIEATFGKNDLPEAGEYETQAYIETIDSGVYYGERAKFNLYNVIEEQ